jgi:putative hydrolase of the HAD superfamily
MPLFENIQAVTFDVGGTLIRPWPSVGHIYCDAAAKHGHPNLDLDTLNKQFAAAWQAKKDFDHSRGAWLELVRSAFAGLVDEASVQGLFDDLYARFAAPGAWRVFEDVHPALDTLRSHGFKLGIVSNWDERLRPLLAELQLTPYFEPIVISVEAGCTKPSPGIFARAVSLLRFPSHSILHIGDSLSEDVLGAQSAGLQGLLLDRKASGARAPSIPSLAELGDKLGIG